MTYHIYMLRCADGTLYTGVTTDIARRVEEHNTSPRAARYTRSRRPVELVYAEKAASRSAALVREAAIKRYTRATKEALAQSGHATKKKGAKRKAS